MGKKLRRHPGFNETMDNNLVNELKTTAVNVIDQRKKDLISMSDWLGRNPEIGHREYRGAWLLTTFLEKEGFVVERKVAGMETAFKATIQGKKKRPVIALMAEYDALPEIGHGCGHNIIGTSVIGAALGLKKVIDQVGGTLVVLGSPAEEVPLLPSSESAPHKPGGKSILIKKGEFDDVDFAMMVHPAQEPFCYMKRTSSAASSGIQVSFIQGVLQMTGKFSEAALQLDEKIKEIKKELPDDANVWIDRRDEASDYVELRVRVSGSDAPTVEVLANRMIMEAETCAREKGVAMYHRIFMNTYADLIWNMPMSEAFRKNLQALGEDPRDSIDRPNRGDEGNVSHVVPAICTWIRGTRTEVPLHSKEFAVETFTDVGHDCIVLGAKSLAMTALDLFSDPDLVYKAIKGFEQVSQVRSSEILARVYQDARARYCVISLTMFFEPFVLPLNRG
jgi:metal-dependent amidase/aminoacylase/carboxypeptidase family protein